MDIFNAFNAFNVTTQSILNSRYIPLINYTWGTTTDSTGVRYLKDSGTLPAYTAELNFGQGVKFNGVDQEIRIQDLSYPEQKMTMGLTFVAGSIPNRYMLELTSNPIIWGGGGHLRFSIAGVSTDFNNILTVGDTYTAFLTIDNGVANAYLNGELLSTFNCGSFDQTQTRNYIGSPDFDSIINDVMVSKQVLTPSQITYQYSSPEKFLYKEDDILKSTILEQSEIDNMVAYFPMCENDEYVRDLVTDTSYLIENYTASVRTDAQNLNAGLQTNLWKRDILGVPYASAFSDLEGDGIGYADTGWVRPNDQYWCLELVIANLVDIESTWGMLDNSGAGSNRVIMQADNNITSSFFGVTNDFLIDEGYHHLVTEFDGIDTLTSTLNGVTTKTTIVANTLATDVTMAIGGTNIDNTSVETRRSITRLFKVHVTPQDHLGLYEKAVKSGHLTLEGAIVDSYDNYVIYLGKHFILAN